jgi:predicted NUDIX family phosphoesterase
MASFLEAAHVILNQIGESLSAREIVARALDAGLITTRGKTPAQTMKAKLSTDILTRKEASAFMRTGPAAFGLRRWREAGTREFAAPRFQRALLDEQVLAVARNELALFVPGPGFWSEPLSGGTTLAALAKPIQRRQAEQRWDLVQLVSGFVVHFRRSIVTYKRSRRLPESRLHGCYSLFFGGHLNPGDIPALFDIFRPQPDVGFTFLARELEEELIVPRSQMPAVHFKGLLYDDSHSISRQHLGIFYDVVLAERDFLVGERGFLMDLRLETPKTILQRRDEFENWSQLLIDSRLLLPRK